MRVYVLSDDGQIEVSEFYAGLPTIQKMSLLGHCFYVRRTTYWPNNGKSILSLSNGERER